jgi:hypothetical protein
VIGSSDEVHVVDALAITGDEGRRSVRKASGSPQTGCDPEISEWGNPPLHRWLSLRQQQKRLSIKQAEGAFVRQQQKRLSIKQAEGAFVRQQQKRLSIKQAKGAFVRQQQKRLSAKEVNRRESHV